MAASTSAARGRAKQPPASPAAPPVPPLPGAPTLAARLLAEASGTFLLVAGVIGTAIFSSGAVRGFDGDAGILGIALAIGLAVIVGAYTVGHVSGGHFNPAVSLGLAVAGRFAWRDVGLYAAAQLVGGIAGAGLLAIIVASAPRPRLAQTFSAVSNGDVGGYGLAAVLVIEFVLTAVLVWVILGVTGPGGAGALAPLAIGFSLTVIHLIAIPISNASVNPARSLATAVFGGGEALGALWIFFVAPVAGAALAGLLHRSFPAKT